MKFLLFIALCFPVSSFAATMDFCNSKDKVSITVEGEMMTIVNGENSETATIRNTTEITGEDAQTDRGLVGEEVKISTVYTLSKAAEEDYIAIIEGISGTKYLVSMFLMEVVGTTALCQ